VAARDKDAEPRGAYLAPREVKRVAARIAPLAGPQQLLEPRLLPQAALRIQAETLLRCGDRYNPMRRRPRARRLRSTLRPPGVRLRTRKPWRRARRVFEG